MADAIINGLGPLNWVSTLPTAAGFHVIWGWELEACGLILDSEDED